MSALPPKADIKNDGWMSAMCQSRLNAPQQIISFQRPQQAVSGLMPVAKIFGKDKGRD